MEGWICKAAWNKETDEMGGLTEEQDELPDNSDGEPEIKQQRCW